ncbi:MAG: helix-turn-helix transcriptional regulator [gamma proteobacterium endosymbiont of Lamellibrachia anaximandri]|nr:helix-turn-helix transcriptional regulator [gamma proteobacterium endosymbiont of Lamellibrachia anaximandri]MBL3619048.1 helix-turn-helix transcriptional regulator [gamma proteobacterium endosymbiont of Lamellibrachia anaximandri]
MPKSINRTYSRYTREATRLLGQMIKLKRTKRKITAKDLAERAGISRGLLQRIEKGDLKCEIGVVFELATLVDIKLFDADNSSLTGHINRTEETLALLPKHVRNTKEVDDEF